VKTIAKGGQLVAMQPHNVVNGNKVSLLRLKTGPTAPGLGTGLVALMICHQEIQLISRVHHT
jgi:hypothetical protein